MFETLKRQIELAKEIKTEEEFRKWGETIMLPRLDIYKTKKKITKAEYSELKGMLEIN